MSVETSLACMEAFAEAPDTVLCGSYHKRDLEYLVSQIDVALGGLRERLASGIQPANVAVCHQYYAHRTDEVTASVEHWAMAGDTVARVAMERTWSARDAMAAVLSDHELGKRTKLWSERSRVKRIAGLVLAPDQAMVVREFSSGEFLGQRSNAEVMNLVRANRYEGPGLIPGKTTRVRGESAMYVP